METILKIGLIVLDDEDRLLVVRKRGGRTFILPGGKPEGDESDLSCLAREQIHGNPQAQAEIDEMRWIDMHAPDVLIADSIRNGVIPALLKS